MEILSDIFNFFTNHPLIAIIVAVLMIGLFFFILKSILFGVVIVGLIFLFLYFVDSGFFKEVWDEPLQINMSEENNLINKSLNYIETDLNEAEIKEIEDGYKIEGKNITIQYLNDNQTIELYLLKDKIKLKNETLKKYLTEEQYTKIKNLIKNKIKNK